MLFFLDKEVKVAEIAVLKKTETLNKTEETSTTDEARSNKAIDEEIDDLVRFKDKWTNQSKNNVDNLIEYGLVEGRMAIFHKEGAAGLKWNEKALVSPKAPTHLICMAYSLDESHWKRYIYVNLAIRVTALSVLLVTRCISQTLGGLVAFR